MRGHFQQHFALASASLTSAEFVVFRVAQATVIFELADDVAQARSAASSISTDKTSVLRHQPQYRHR